MIDLNINQMYIKTPHKPQHHKASNVYLDCPIRAYWRDSTNIIILFCHGLSVNGKLKKPN